MVPLAYLFAGWRLDVRGGSSTGVSSSYGGSGGAALNSKKVGTSGGSVRVRYDMHLPAFFIRDGNNARTLPAGIVLPTLHGLVIFKNWYLCGMCWD